MPPSYFNDSGAAESLQRLVDRLQALPQGALADTDHLVALTRRIAYLSESDELHIDVATTDGSTSELMTWLGASPNEATSWDAGNENPTARSVTVSHGQLTTKISPIRFSSSASTSRDLFRNPILIVHFTSPVTEDLLGHWRRHVEGRWVVIIVQSSCVFDTESLVLEARTPRRHVEVLDLRDQTLDSVLTKVVSGGRLYMALAGWRAARQSFEIMEFAAREGIERLLVLRNGAGGRLSGIAQRRKQVPDPAKFKSELESLFAKRLEELFRPLKARDAGLEWNSEQTFSDVATRLQRMPLLRRRTSLLGNYLEVAEDFHTSVIDEVNRTLCQLFKHDLLVLSQELESARSEIIARMPPNIKPLQIRGLSLEPSETVAREVRKLNLLPFSEKVEHESPLWGILQVILSIGGFGWRLWLKQSGQPGGPPELLSYLIAASMGLNGARTLWSMYTRRRQEMPKALQKARDFYSERAQNIARGSFTAWASTAETASKQAIALMIQTAVQSVECHSAELQDQLNREATHLEAQVKTLQNSDKSLTEFKAHLASIQFEIIEAKLLKHRQPASASPTNKAV